MNIVKDRPLGITMGCPAGVGPEIIVKAFSKHPEWHQRDKIMVFGDKAILRRAMGIIGIELPILDADSPDLGLHLFSVTSLDTGECPFGKPTGTTGEASYRYIVAAIKAAQEGRIGGIVTAPISKEGLRMAGIPYPGHTEILADHTNTRDYRMMLMGDRLKVVLVTIHMALSKVPQAITKEKVLETIIIVNEGLKRDFGIAAPRIAVAGLNPHAGEGGMFGNEETEVIEPAVREARSMGIECSGPYPPDTVFYRALHGEFHVVCAQYHDQGLIPLKLIHFEDGVNVTLNLPIVRTSVDHGTAYDIAGHGLASPTSLVAAVDVAREMMRCRRKYQ